MNATPIPTLKIFISYSHQDMNIKTEIERYILSVNWSIEVMSDNNVSAGTDWSKVLTGFRNAADIFLLLVSKNYLNSETVRNTELPQIMGRSESGSVYIIPVILETCDWQKEPYARFQALPKFGQPISDFKNKEEAFQEIRNALEPILHLRDNAKATATIDQEKQEKTKTLILTDCGLENIPRDLLEMPWLEYVYLDRNYIKKIENLESLTNLTYLDLANNEIAQIEGLENLKALSTLDLQHNKLSKIENLDRNLSLETLGLSSNELENLSGISHLKKLNILYAGSNKLTDLSPLSALPLLKRMVLSNNLIRSLRPILSHIRNGLDVSLQFASKRDDDGIFIKDNPTLAEPSMEVILQGREAILKYFSDSETYGNKKLEILKLILIGNSRVGKSNFSEFLREKALTPTHNSTHLLDIQHWDANFLKGESGQPMRINIFDFGGQDYYHDSHRMYYSHDTAYVLLWDVATNKYSPEPPPDSPDYESVLKYENFPLEYWLESIRFNLKGKYSDFYKNKDEKIPQTTGNTSPVLILQNKIDIEEGRLDQKKLCDSYNNISGFFNVSLTAKKRTAILLEVLSDYLNALNLSHRQLIEYEHRIVMDFLNREREFKVVSLQAFKSECEEIINDPTVTFNDDNARIMAETLNAIGIIFYDKQTGTNDLIFTKITQLNTLIKEVMAAAERGNDKGIFRKDQIFKRDKNPKKDKAPKEDYGEAILALLARNNSIIPLNSEEYLVPQFLPLIPDPSIDFFLHAFAFCQVRFLYQAYFHKSLLQSLFSEYLTGTLAGTTVKDIKNVPFWRNGIIISRGTGKDKQMVLVEFLKTEKMGIVNIKTMTSFRKDGLEGLVEKSIETLSEGWTCAKEISVNSSDFFDVKGLHKSVEDERLFEFSKNGNRFTVNDFKHLTEFKNLPKKLFISYSSKNAEFIKRFVIHLEVLKAAGTIDPWYDRMIESGTKWDDTIRNEMKNSDVVIFLLSPDFLATEYIMKEEIPLAVKQMQDQKSKFFFIELQSCGWKRTDIAKYQQTDDSGEIGKNVILIERADNDAKWNKVIDELEAKMRE